MTNNLVVRLRRENPFYDLFLDGQVPVKLPVAVEADLDGIGAADVYLMDTSRISQPVLDAVARRVAERLGARLQEVRGELVKNGLPIRASEVTLTPAIELRFII